MKLQHLQLLLYFIFFSLCSIQLNAQTISGTITDEQSGEVLIGATIVERGTTNGTITDLDGNFRMNVSSIPATLLVSYTGYTSKEVDISSASVNLAISLKSGMNLDEIVVTGSRGKPRAIIESPVPIDNINLSELQSSGQTSIDQMINYRVPSYNSSNQTISDATAHFDPSELRNMGPSRTLVLVNGKRKNQSALVYVNDTPGKGEVGVDMKSIPASAIERVEVLRDGAAAQYGSDAVAGVINIVLKESTDGQVNVGTGITTKGDGLMYEASVYKGFKLNENTSLSLTADYYHQDYTDRAGEPGGDGLFGVIFESDSILNGLEPWIQDNPDLGMIVGQPEYDKYSIYSNFSTKYSDTKGEFYFNAGYTRRNGKSFALYRAPYWITDDAGLLTDDGEDYVGFQPTFETGINDVTATIGNKYNFNGWKTDVSLTYGYNDVDYTIGNTINPALLPNSPTEFDAGAYAFGNILGNIDVSKDINEKLTVFVGTEARRESFKVTAGQEESYVDGGAQSFPGLQPSNELDESRTNIGIYTGADYDINENFLVGGALRFENYSDFGSNLSWKLSSRYLFNERKGAVRASISTGFRAPSLHQIYLSNVQTLVSGGTVSNQGTFNNVSDVVRGLGIPALDAETSLNLTAGATYRLTDELSITADYYNIRVDDRVLFTGEIGFIDDDVTSSVEQILIDNSVTSIKFFVNAMDTRTQGVDVVLNYDGLRFGDDNRLGAVLGINANSTKILGTITAPGVVGEEGYDIFNRKEQSRVTTARPNFKAMLGLNLGIKDLNVSLNNTYFGKVTWQHADTPDFDQTFAGKMVTDLIVGYTFAEKVDVNLTVNNLFNVYPDEIDPKDDFVTDLGGRFRYPWEVNQFGFNGTMLKLGASFRF